MGRLAVVLLSAVAGTGCLRYAFDHELWLRVDGSGTVQVTGRPELWAAFKQLVQPGADAEALSEAARELFERSGLQVRRATLTNRDGRAYLFVVADFKDVNTLTGSPAFPDLRISLARDGDRLVLDGRWARPSSAAGAADGGDGVAAVRIHLPSKVYEHRNAAEGVERGNIVAWRERVADVMNGRVLAFGAIMDRRSILGSAVVLFAGAVALGLALLGTALYLALRKGRRQLRAAGAETTPRA